VNPKPEAASYQPDNFRTKQKNKIKKKITRGGVYM
jgi:hypothetical protein